MQIVLPPFFKGSALKGKILLPRGVDPFSEEACCTGKQTGSHKSCLPCNVLLTLLALNN